MAFASSRLGAQEAIIKPCDLCEEEDDVNWFCKDCGQSLCERCKKTHLRASVSKRHEVLSIFEGLIIEKRFISTLCDKHKEAFSLYCKTCKSSICTRCLLKKHKKHDFVDLRNVQGEINGILKQKAADITQIEHNIESLTQYEQDFDSYLAAWRVSIGERVQAIRYTADEEGKRLLSRLEMIKEKNTKITREAKDSLIKQKETFNMKTSDAERELKLQTTTTLYSYVEKVRSDLQALTPNLAQIPDNIDFFNGGNVNAGQIGEMLGLINETPETFPRLQVEAQHQVKAYKFPVLKYQLKTIGKLPKLSFTEIFSVYCTRDGHVWVGRLSMVYRLDTNGDLVIKTKARAGTANDYRCDYLACFTSGDALVSYGRTQYIDRFTSDGKRIDFIDMSPDLTYDIAVTGDNQVVVNVNLNSLAILSEKGQKLKEIKPDVGEFHTFCLMQDGSYRIAIHQSPFLVTVDKDGKVTKSKNITKSDIAYMTCDRHGNAIASNYSADAIYVISKVGVVIRTYQIPGTNIGRLAVDNNGRLLIVTDNKTITVAEYME